ncbi:triose-phosphate isomerase [Petroclostridium sp. X23]|uniref:triose-phosphate isomerase n=1 Tax=Petroclostridium sp. X23 TaxID=3045146 RepID=UPI0024AD305D|nr:triose-phosphate isomerase [Petroclostridium sp. X23]WHH60911.1 triose-phosphate isomerase [Petroclostridium sp. X23]
MRKPMIAGNWKMNRIPEQAVQYVRALIPLVKDAACDIIVMPPVICCSYIKPIIEGTNIRLGAQNVHFAECGPYTGELSVQMLMAIGVEYVIIGHSERRQYFCENDKTINLKTKAAVKSGLKPIVCVGEMKEERDSGYADIKISYQVLMALNGLTDKEIEKTVIAYEPIWAIGTGVMPALNEANNTLSMIRSAIERNYGNKLAQKVRLLYGGSMRPNNAGEIIAQPEIDGGLVGAATKDVEDFAKVVNFQKGGRQ